MALLVLNAGSSSLKYALFQTGGGALRRVLWGLAEGIGTETQCRIRVAGPMLEACGLPACHSVALPNHHEALSRIAGLLPDALDIASVGHRVVHGGERFTTATLVDPDVLQGMRAASSLAPLHNPWNILGIEVSQEMFGGCPQVAVFDTAFHSSLPAHAYLYALPYELYSEHGVRKYGFHGTSYQYLLQAAAHALGKPVTEVNMIACHIGSGASMCAIKEGKCIDTTMGLTPLEGLVMGTRCGDIDPAVPLHLMEQLGYSINEMKDLLNKKSGLKGLCGLSDNRDVEASYAQQEKNGVLAKMIQVHRMRKYLGAYIVALEGQVDALVFAGGIGENSHLHRSLVCRGLERLGLELDERVNTENGGQFTSSTRLDTGRSQTQIWVIPTDEELCIAQQTQAVTRCLAE